MIINGGSSSGKTGIVRCLQAVLDEPWLAFGIDSLVDAMPAALQASDAGIDFAPDGAVVVGSAFRELELAWMSGIVQICRSGARVIVDDVFLGGASSQQRWRDVIGDVETLWVGVHCAPEVVTGREIARGDRVPGMAAKQALIVHDGVKYDVEVDSSHTESIECARSIARYLSSSRS